MQTQTYANTHYAENKGKDGRENIIKSLNNSLL